MTQRTSTPERWTPGTLEVTVTGPGYDDRFEPRVSTSEAAIDIAWGYVRVQAELGARRDGMYVFRCGGLVRRKVLPCCIG